MLAISLGGAIVAVIVLMLWIIWLYLLIMVFIDVFRSHDLSGWAKALWVFFVLILPFVGVLIYLIARGDEMAQHSRHSQYGTGPTKVSTELAELAKLRNQGLMSDEEYEKEKARVLSAS